MAERPTPTNVRIGSLRGFLPLSEDIVSTRGQRLPSLIHGRSTANIKDVRPQLEQRRLSAYYQATNEDREQGSNHERDIETAAGDVRKGARVAPARKGSGDKKRMSKNSDMPMTPQMRSMRLIGNTNPRYQWYERSHDGMSTGTLYLIEGAMQGAVLQERERPQEDEKAHVRSYFNCAGMLD